MAKNLTSADLHDFFEYLHLRNITNLDKYPDLKAIFWPDPLPIEDIEEVEHYENSWHLVESITSCTGIVLNLIVIFVVMAVPSLRYATTSLFMISLSVADLLVSGAVMTISLIMGYTTMHLYVQESTRAACLIWACFIVVACASSALNVCAITLDRYIWIVRPLNYSNIMTKPRLHMLIFAIWSISLMLGVPPLVLGALVQSTDVKNSKVKVRLHDNMCRLLPTKIYIVVIVVVVIILPCTFVICAYLRIFQYVVRQSRNSIKNSYIVGGSKYSDAGKSSFTSSYASYSKTKGKKMFYSVQFTLPLETIKLSNKETSFQSLPPESNIDNIRHSEDRDSKASSTRYMDNEKAFQATQNKYAVESMKDTKRDTHFHKETNFQSLPLESDVDKIRQSEEGDSKASSIKQMDNETPSQETQNQSAVKSTKDTKRDLLFHKEISFQSFPLESDVDNIRQSEEGDSKTSSISQLDNETPSQETQNQSAVKSTKDTKRYSIFQFLQLESQNPCPKSDKKSSVRLSTQSLGRIYFTRSELKALGVMSIICGTFLVCWLPFGIISILSGTNTKRFTDIREVFLWLAYTNSCLNPIIYTTLNSSFRKGLRDHAVLLWRRHKDRRSLRRESKFPFSR